MTKKVDDSDARRKWIEEHEREQARRRADRKAVREKIAELEDCDPRDDVPRWSAEVDQRIQAWTVRVLRELPFADALHLLARSSDESRDAASAARLASLAAKRLAPDDAQLFIDALELQRYFADVVRWTAGTLTEREPGIEALRGLLEPARERVSKARSALGADRERSFRRDAFVALEDLYMLVRESGPLRPVWLDNRAAVEKQLSIQTRDITTHLRERYPVVCERLTFEHVHSAAIAYTGYEGGAFVAVPEARRAEVFARLAKHTTAGAAPGSLENEFRAIRRDDPHFARLRAESAKRVPPSSNER